MGVCVIIKSALISVTPFNSVAGSLYPVLEGWQHVSK